MDKIYFLSSNKYKIKEVKNMLSSSKIKVISVSMKIKEIQSEDMKEIVEDKVLKGFRKIGRPVMVEQTGLFINDFGDLPGGLTQIFWDSLQADKFSSFFSKATVTAKTIVAFCDGKQIKSFEGEVSGKIVSPPRGNRDFQWDCVFQPDGYYETFSEMGEKKNSISMRKIALEKFNKYLKE